MSDPCFTRSLPLVLLGALCCGMQPTPGVAQMGRSPIRGHQPGMAPPQPSPGNGQSRNHQDPNRGAEAAAWTGLGVGLGVIAVDAAIQHQRRNQDAHWSEAASPSGRRRPDMGGPGYPPPPSVMPNYSPQTVVPQYVQPEYAPPQYVQAQPVAVAPVQYAQPAAVAVAVPANSVPQPAIPQANQLPSPGLPSVAPRNAVGSQLALAGPADRSKIAKAIEKQLKGRSRELGKEVEAAGLAMDDVTTHLLDVARSHGAATKDLEAALEDGTPRDVDKALKGVAGITDGERRKLVAEVAAAQAGRELQEGLRAGASHEDLADAKDRLDDALARLGGSKPGAGGKVDALRREAESALQLAEIRDLAKAKPTLPDKPSGWIASPDELTIVEAPGYPPGSTLLLGPDLVVLGSAENAFTVHPGALADLGIAVPAGPPVADASADKAAAGGRGVLIVNPGETGGGIHYTVSGHSYTMQPGESQTLAAGTAWVINFDRGENRGEAQYALADGAYEFFVGPTGWDLRSKSYSVTIDNSGNVYEFRFVVDGKINVVAARQTRTLQSKWPVALGFDRGDGRATAWKELAAGTYRVGVDFASNQLELYPGKAGTVVADSGAGSSLSPRGN